jgi:hypothetical protein
VRVNRHCVMRPPEKQAAEVGGHPTAQLHESQITNHT